MAEKYHELTAMSDDEIIALYDHRAEHTVTGVQWYSDELSRRETSRQTAALVSLTRRLEILTWAVVVLTIITAGCSIAALVMA